MGEESINNLLLDLQEGNSDTINRKMWQPEIGVINYLPFSIDSILELKKPYQSEDSLNLVKRIKSKNFELLILKKEWKKEEFPYAPIIISEKSKQIIGKVLQFNEVTPFLTESEQKEIASLGINWTFFVIKNKTEK